MPYYTLLPRKVDTVTECMCLTSDGERCSRAAIYEVDVHLDSELYHYPDRINWVRVNVCSDHLPDSDRRKLKE